jgi:hypothetical protein
VLACRPAGKNVLWFLWAAVEAAVGADGILLLPPVFDNDLGLLQGKEQVNSLSRRFTKIHFFDQLVIIEIVTERNRD